MQDDTPRDTLLTGMFVLNTVSKELHKTDGVISGDGLQVHHPRCVISN